MRDGNLATCVESDAGDEVGVLARSFNDMSTRMQQLVGNLEEMVQQRTTELTDARDRLEALVRELDEKNQALEILSVTDRLTGLANRRKLEATLQSEILRARRYGKIFSVIMLDVDRFKSVNDTFGHPTGDAVLEQLADILRTNSRETDIVGRWGGEEFLIVCPETNLMVVTALPNATVRNWNSTTSAQWARSPQASASRPAARATTCTASSSARTRPCTWPRTSAATAWWPKARVISTEPAPALTSPAHPGS